MTPYYDDGTVTIYHGDCREILPTLYGDAIITDPPYNVGFRYGGGFRDNDPDYVASMRDLWAGARPQTLVWFPGTANLFDVPAMLDETGYERRHVLGWHRKEFAGDKWSYGPAMSWEPIVWASREARAFNKRFGTMGRDFMVVDATHGDRARFEHPCPKPLKVMQWLIGLFVPSPGSVIDPFAGSGTTLRAAKDLGRTAIGIEINEAFCEVAARRMGQEVMAL